MAENILFICQNNYSYLLIKELLDNKFSILKSGNNWVFTKLDSNKINIDLCFPHCALINSEDMNNQSVHEVPDCIVNFFYEKNKNNKIEKEFPVIFSYLNETKGLSKRVKNIEKRFNELFKKRMSRVSKFVKKEINAYNEIINGLFVFFYDFDKFFISSKAIFFGQRRMKDDIMAPSRSYLKVEEAYKILGKEPEHGQSVCDLGAAPGGWSYSASKRGAKVLAIDNGKLKKGALDDPYLKHLNEDAFKFKPHRNKKFDWLFCDIVEHPKQVLNLLQKWLENRWCRNFIVNLKFGYVDPILLLKDINGENSFLHEYCIEYKVRHLYHDREEITLMGIVK